MTTSSWHPVLTYPNGIPFGCGPAFPTEAQAKEWWRTEEGQATLFWWSKNQNCTAHVGQCHPEKGWQAVPT